MKRGKKLLLLLSLLLAATAQARIHFVTPHGDDFNDGQSWSTAKRDLQAVFASCSPGDEVWIAAGTYVPAAYRDWVGPRLYAESFMLPPDIKIYGGFAGTENSPEERALADTDGNGLVELWELANPTIWQHSDDYAGQVAVTSEAEGTGGLLDGITFTNGQAVGSGNDGYGGGLLLRNGTEVTACIFTRNCAYSGAGLAILGPGQATYCRLDNNYARPGEGEGGGAYLGHAEARISNCLIARNGSDNGGGGLMLDSGAQADFCTIVANFGHSAGAGIHIVNGTLNNSLVWGNDGPSQVAIDAAGTVRRCGLAGGLVGEEIIPLQERNSGDGGPASNDNYPDLYYACFANYLDGDYRLAPGSYAINRALPEAVTADMTDACGNPRCQRGLPDLGAYESEHGGCLAVRTLVEHPLIYGSTNRVTPRWGIFTPDGIDTNFSFDKSWAEITRNRDGFALSGQPAGRLKLTTYAYGFDDTWQQRQTVTTLDVYRRPLEISAESVAIDNNSQLSEITTSISAGSLLPGDTLDGTATTGGDSQTDPWLVTQGTLQISDNNQGNNYDITFVGKKIPVNYTLNAYNSLEIQYGDSVSDGLWFGFFNDPEDDSYVDGVFEILTAVNGRLPAGEHTMECVFHPQNNRMYTDVYFTFRLNVRKITLTTSIQGIAPRYYGEDNPEYTIVYDGFLPDEDESCLTGTAYIQGMPGKYDLPGDYMLSIEGISSENYDIFCMLDFQTVFAIPIVVQGKITASDLQEGDMLFNSSLTGTVINTLDNSVVEGDLVWSNNALSQPPVGTTTYQWVFFPYGHQYSYLSGEVEVTVHPRAQQTNQFLTATAPRGTKSLSDANGDLLSTQNAVETAETPDLAVLQTSSTDMGSDLTQPGQLPVATPQILVITPLPSSKIYGDDDSAVFTWQLADNTLADGITITGSLEREPGENCGDYAITLGTLTAGDGYALALQPAVFQIRPRRLNLLTGDYSKMLGDADPELTWTLLDAEWAEEVNITGQLSREPGETIGTYRLDASGLSCDDNFLLTVACGTLEITPAGFQAREVAASELVYGDKLSASTLSGQVVFTDGQIPQDGNFSWDNPESLLAAGLTEQNWTFHFADATNAPLHGTVSLTVLPRLLSVTSLDVTKMPGEADPALPYTYAVEDLQGAPCTVSGSLSREAGELPGTYATTLGNLSFGDNFQVEFTPGVFRILANKTVVDDDWDGWLEPGDIVTVNGRDYTFGSDAFATLEDALEATAPGGTVILCDGAYALPSDNSRWQAPHPVSLRGLTEDCDDSATVLLNPLAMTRTPAWTEEDERAVVTLDNLQIQVTDTAEYALRIGDFRSAILASCALSGGIRTLLAANLQSLEMTSCSLASAGTCLTLGLPEADAEQNSLRDFTMQKNEFRRLSPSAFYLQAFDARLNGNGLGLAYGNTYDGIFTDGESDDATVASLKQFVGDREQPDWPCPALLRLRKERLTAVPSAAVCTLGDENLTLQIFGEDGRLIRNLHGAIQVYDADGALLGTSPLVYSRETEGYSLLCPALTPAAATLRFTVQGQSSFCRDSATCQISVRPPAQIDTLAFLVAGQPATNSDSGDYQAIADENLPLALQASYGLWHWPVATDAATEYSLPAADLSLVAPGVVSGIRANETYTIGASYQGQSATATVRLKPAAAVILQATTATPHLAPGGWADISLFAADAFGNRFPVLAEDEQVVPAEAGTMLAPQKLFVHQDFHGETVEYAAACQGLSCSLEIPVELRHGEADSDWQLSCDGTTLCLQYADYQGPARSGWHRLDDRTQICLDCSESFLGDKRTITCRLVGYEIDGQPVPLAPGFAVPSLSLVIAADGKLTIAAAAGRHDNASILELDQDEQRELLPFLALTSTFSALENTYGGCLLLEK